jgi:hypothetical protein
MICFYLGGLSVFPPLIKIDEYFIALSKSRLETISGGAGYERDMAGIL